MKVQLTRLLAEAGQTVSMSEGRRYVVTGIVKLNGEVVRDLGVAVEVNPGDTIQVGKRTPITVTAEMLEHTNDA